MPASLAVGVQHAYPLVGGGQLTGNPQHPIGAGVVYHGDRPLERELITQVRAQHLQAAGQCAFLVVHRHHHIYRGGLFDRPPRGGGALAFV